jgi:hypothetical protein
MTWNLISGRGHRKSGSPRPHKEIRSTFVTGVDPSSPRPWASPICISQSACLRFLLEGVCFIFVWRDVMLCLCFLPSAPGEAASAWKQATGYLSGPLQLSDGWVSLLCKWGWLLQCHWPLTSPHQITTVRSVDGLAASQPEQSRGASNGGWGGGCRREEKSRMRGIETNSSQRNHTRKGKKF